MVAPVPLGETKAPWSGGQVLPPEAGTQCPVLGIVLAHGSPFYREGIRKTGGSAESPKAQSYFQPDLGLLIMNQQ